MVSALRRLFFFAIPKNVFVAALAVLAVVRPAGAGQVRYLKFEEVHDTLRRNAGSGIAGSEIQDHETWDSWVRQRDAEVRGRIERGTEDSISNLVLYGTSFTSLPRIESSERAAEAGKLTPQALLRIRALVLAVGAGSKNERIQFVRAFLANKRISNTSAESYLASNLRRFVAEQEGYQQKLQDSAKAADPSAVYLTRGTLYENRGLSVDTSLLPNFGLEETLRAMLLKGALRTGSMRRIAVIGPGLDFTDKRDGYDFYPLQTVQPFALLEAVARLGLGKPDTVEVVCLDLNPAVIAHVKNLAERARAHRPYVVQLPRDIQANWSDEAVAYWKSFGDVLGAPVKPLPVPMALSRVAVRAVAIRPRFAAHVQVFDANVVAQTLDFPSGQGFDLVVATNVLVYYDRLQQAIAMANIAHMMNPGGIFLANNVLPAQHTNQLEYLGRRTTAYASGGEYGDDVVVYRRR